MKNKELFEKAINDWGWESQLEMAIEEMSELIFALQKFKRYNYTSKNDPKYEINVQEEIADVTIMMKQLKLIFNEFGIVDEFFDKKIKRLEKRLNFK